MSGQTIGGASEAAEVFESGGARLVNADCFDFLPTIPNDSINLFLIDPPYEVSRDTNFQSGTATGRDTDRFRVSMDFGDWDSGFAGLDAVVREAFRVLKKGGTLICFYDVWKITPLKDYFEQAGFKQLRLIEWLKTNPVPLNSKMNYLTNAREIALAGVKKSKPTFHSEYDNGVYRYPICHDAGRFHPTQKPLALIEAYAGAEYDENDPTSCFSREIPVAELKNIHPSFESTNGCQWARSDGCYLGKRYKIKRPKQGGKVVAVQLDGPNRNSVKKHRGVRADIKAALSGRPCAILDVRSSVEIDHKNGRYDDLSNLSAESQRIDDFQPLSKAANDAKRQHCKECVRTGKRYDARRLGYKEGFVVGDENTTVCHGCCWFDPKRFNRLISKDFVKQK